MIFQGPGDNRIGTLVVETEEDKWVYKVRNVNRLHDYDQTYAHMISAVHASQQCGNDERVLHAAIGATSVPCDVCFEFLVFLHSVTRAR